MKSYYLITASLNGVVYPLSLVSSKDQACRFCDLKNKIASILNDHSVVYDYVRFNVESAPGFEIALDNIEEYYNSLLNERLHNKNETFDSPLYLESSSDDRNSCES